MKHLHIIWTNTDPITSEHMVMMYATNSMLNNWWDKVTVVAWGGTQKLIIDSQAIQLKMEIAREAGVEFSACISCAVNLGVRETLEEQGISVMRWGEKLSKLIQEGEPVLTF